MVDDFQEHIMNAPSMEDSETIIVKDITSDSVKNLIANSFEFVDSPKLDSFRNELDSIEFRNELDSIEFRNRIISLSQQISCLQNMVYNMMEMYTSFILLMCLLSLCLFIRICFQKILKKSTKPKLIVAEPIPPTIDMKV